MSIDKKVNEIFSKIESFSNEIVKEIKNCGKEVIDELSKETTLETVEKMVSTTRDKTFENMLKAVSKNMGEACTHEGEEKDKYLLRAASELISFVDKNK